MLLSDAKKTSSFSNQCLPVALILGLKPCENSLIHVGKWVDALISKSYLGNHTVEISWVHLLLCHRKIEGTVLYYLQHGLMLLWKLTSGSIKIGQWIKVLVSKPNDPQLVPAKEN